MPELYRKPGTRILASIKAAEIGCKTSSQHLASCYKVPQGRGSLMILIGPILSKAPQSPYLIPNP